MPKQPTTRRIIITIPIVTGAGYPNPKLCGDNCVGLGALGPYCKAFPLRNGESRDLKVTDPDGYPTRCRQCREAEVE
jgi:hypothetical protein